MLQFFVAFICYLDDGQIIRYDLLSQFQQFIAQGIPMAPIAQCSPPPAPDSAPKESKYKLKVFITVLLAVLAVIFAAVTHLEYQSFKDCLLFTNAKTKKFQGQIQLLTSIAYQFSLFIIGNTVLIFLLTSLLNRAYDQIYVMALRRNISNSLEQLAIFLGLYAYVVVQGGLGLNKTELVLLANWFVVGRYLYGVGSLLETWTGLNWRELGVVLNQITVIALVLQVLGFSIFDFI